MRKLWAFLGPALLLLTLGCGGDPGPAAPKSAAPTTLDQLADGSVRVVRVAFCDLVPAKAVRAALAAKVTRARSWRNGDPVPEAGGQTGHELGCAWFAGQGRAARAWVFAQPVRPAFAATLVRRAASQPRCRATPSKAFGTPSLVQTCREAGHRQRVRRAGLFGDTWLTCEVSGPGTPRGLRQRADAWCLGVANAPNPGAGAE
jgi:hypothetical protein